MSVRMIEINSRYKGACCVCGAPFEKGSPISPAPDHRFVRHGAKMNQRSRWGHAACIRDAMDKIDGGSGMEMDVRENGGATNGDVESDANVGATELLRSALERVIDARFDSKSIGDLVSKGDLDSLLADFARREDLDDVIESVRKMRPVTNEIRIVASDGEHKQHVEGVTHKAFKDVVHLAANRINVLLVGPSQCGKTHLAGQVAQALGLSFAHISCTGGMSEGQLTGRYLPVGEGGRFEFVTTQFIRAYEEGGVFLLDEIDAADENVMLVINSATANGTLPLPNRVDRPVAHRHEDFVLLAGANTFGSGADREYVGRNQLDAATLARFQCGTIAMDYDEEMERTLVGDDEVVDLIQSYRKKMRAAGIRRLCTMRFMMDAAKMKRSGAWDMDRIKDAFFSGWSADERTRVE